MKSCEQKTVCVYMGRMERVTCGKKGEDGDVRHVGQNRSSGGGLIHLRDAAVRWHLDASWVCSDRGGAGVDVDALGAGGVVEHVQHAAVRRAHGNLTKLHEWRRRKMLEQQRRCRRVEFGRGRGGRGRCGRVVGFVWDDEGRHEDGTPRDAAQKSGRPHAVLAAEVFATRSVEGPIQTKNGPEGGETPSSKLN